jgi:hypothetical protein
MDEKVIIFSLVTIDHMNERIQLSRTVYSYGEPNSRSASSNTR